MGTMLFRFNLKLNYKYEKPLIGKTPAEMNKFQHQGHSLSADKAGI